jgi:hypothetical protein
MRPRLYQTPRHALEDLGEERDREREREREIDRYI